MKRILLFFLVTLFSIELYAQEVGIKFIDNPLWKEALSIAAKENKLIFIDCYTTWCGPCKALAKDVFSQKEVGDYMNSKFINVKIDMEKGDGPELNATYKKYIPGYPTMMLINAKGEVVHQIVGFKTPAELIKAIEDGLSGKTVASMAERYAKGGRSVEFIKEYLETLNTAFKRDEMEALVNEYVKSLPMEDLKKKEVIELYIPYLKDVYSPQYDFIIRNINHYNYKLKDFDRYALAEQLNRMIERAVKDIVTYRESNGKFTPLDPSKDKIAVIRGHFHRYSFRDRYQLDAKLIIHELNVAGNYQRAIELIQAASQLGVFGYGEQSQLVEYTNFYVNHLDDKKLLKEYLSFMETKEVQIPENKRNDEFNFYEALAKLYVKVGDKKNGEKCDKISKTGKEIVQAKFKEYLEKK